MSQSWYLDPPAVESALQGNLDIQVLVEDVKLTIHEAGPASPALSPQEFNELWDDVRTKADTTQQARKETTQETSNGEGNDKARTRRVQTHEHDSDFAATNLKDIFAVVQDDAQFTEEDLEGLDRYLPSKIVDTSRDQALGCIKLGDTEGACEALESAFVNLKLRLREQKHINPTPWKVSMAEILIDQGRRQEARAVLSKLPSPTHKSGSLCQHLGQQCTAADIEYAKMLEMVQVEAELDLCRRAEDWDKVRVVAQELHGIDPSYFDLDKPMDRFNQIRRILNAGMLQEVRFKKADDPDARILNLTQALEIYNHGCYASEVYNEFFDATEATVSGFDHSDCANIFFSAARICHHFDSLNYGVPPRSFKCKGPVLTCPDWKHQALHFLERGRARALLDSIIRGRVVDDVRQRLIKNNIILIAEAAGKVLHRRSSAMSSTRISRGPSITRSDQVSQSLTPTKPKSTRQSTGHLRSDSSVQRRPSACRQAVGQPLGLTTSNFPESAQVSLPPSPAALTPTLTKEEHSSLRAQMNWRRLLLGVLTQGQVGSAQSIEDMRACIPPDTLVVEYALASRAPCGIMVIVAAKDAIKAVEWTETNTEEIQRCIGALRASMETFDDSMNPTRSSSPRKPSALNRRDSAVYQKRLDGLLQKLVVGPVERHLKGKRNLIIIPSGDLVHVPWCIFFDLPISVVPSLEIWTRLQAQTSLKPVDQPKVTVVSTAPEDKAKKLNNEPGWLRNIPFSRIEALYIARLHSQIPFLADDKAHADLARHAKDSHILHISAHSSFNAAAPLSSSLELFTTPLTIRHWRGLALTPALVVFSSCLSGFSRAYDSGSTIGFAHALLGSGTGAFIGSLWQVDDRATLLLMALFYDELARPQTPVEALFGAQTRMRNLTTAALNDVVDRLETGLSAWGPRETRLYVVGKDFFLAELRKTSAAVWREERYWAGFVLTGYGARCVHAGTGEGMLL
ncbi:hypothetical protein SVAN01_04496 [Stagonosporopsis vannaccii]|nr:hypothetical protein SVAN01_04496 [Stagonosporopsis vannaccii]